MTEKRFVMNNPNDWGFPITDNVTGKVYSCDSNILMKDLCGVVNAIVDENEQLKSEINMLKVTIGRNEAHIKRLTEKSNWRTSAYD